MWRLRRELFTRASSGENSASKQLAPHQPRRIRPIISKNDYLKLNRSRLKSYAPYQTSSDPAAKLIERS
jgi:hypothetical protein